MSNSAIAASGLRKAYGDKTVLDGIDLDVPAGTVFSLLGPNGAGKTTAVNVLTTLLKADGGTARVAGHDIATETKAVRAAIGVTGQFAAVDELLTGQENLQLIADLKHLGTREGQRVVTELLERFDLAESAGKPASTYSGGMRRKLDLGASLVHMHVSRLLRSAQRAQELVLYDFLSRIYQSQAARRRNEAASLARSVGRSR